MKFHFKREDMGDEIMKKKIIFIIGGILAFLVACFLNANQSPVTFQNPQVSFEETKTTFYYDQLTEEEKSVCNQVIELCKTLKGGEICLDKPLSAESIERIDIALAYDANHRFWPYVGLLGFDDENRWADKDWTKLLVLVNTEEISKELKDFRCKEDADDKLLNYDELKELIENTTVDKTYYEEINKKIETEEKAIIDAMPKEYTEKEAVNYFINCLNKKLKYDMEFFKENEEVLSGKSEDLHFAEWNKYASLSCEKCITDGNAVCGGYSILLSRLCNRVGIASYVVIGQVYLTQNEAIGHAWTAVVIAGKTYYADATNAYQLVEYGRLWTKEDSLIQEGWYEFSPHFEY